MIDYLKDRRMRMLLAGMAISLSGVTALSVGMAMSAMIQDPFLAVVFAAAAVVLDLYKYIAWPIALSLLANRKRAYAALMISSALVLGVVSAWATYDRLLTAITSSQAKDRVVQQQIADLHQLKADALRQVTRLDGEARSIGLQAQQLRDRGVITKAQDLETSASLRIAKQRDQALQRLEAASLEAGKLQLHTLGVVSLPAMLVVILCAGFAVALEAVPALIGCALRTGIAAEPSPEALRKPEQSQISEVVSLETSTATKITAQQQELFGPADGELMQSLLENVRATASGTPIRVRDFAAKLKVGNKRAIKLFKSAMDLGALRKTTSGYVAA